MPTMPTALLIGDDTPARVLVRLLLDGDGFEVSEYNTPPATAHAAPVALVALVDPASGELAAIVQHLRRLADPLAVVVVARAASPELRRQAFMLGVRDVIGLPAAPRELATRLRVAAGVACRTPAIPAVVHMS